VRSLHSRAVRVVVLCLLLTAAAPLAAHAAAGSAGDKSPCWKRLLNDWYDGTINNRYPLPCYHQAIAHLPTDLVVYGSAKDDILAARQAAAAGHAAPPEKGHPVSSGTTAASTTTTTTETVTTNGTTTTATTVLVVPVKTPPKKKGGIGGALDRLNPGNPDSFPLPLLILGALAILLVIAGGAGMLWQRSHPRDDGAEA